MNTIINNNTNSTNANSNPKTKIAYVVCSGYYWDTCAGDFEVVKAFDNRNTAEEFTKTLRDGYVMEMELNEKIPDNIGYRFDFEHCGSLLNVSLKKRYEKNYSYHQLVITNFGERTYAHIYLTADDVVRKGGEEAVETMLEELLYLPLSYGKLNNTNKEEIQKSIMDYLNS